MIERPGYYAVIPASVRYDDQISPNARLLYGEISALIGPSGFCYASNEYFAQLYGITEVSVSRLISKLEAAGHIRRELERDENGQITARRLYLRETSPLNNIVNTSQQNCKEGINTNVKETNLSITDKKEKIKRKKPGEAHLLDDEQMREQIIRNVASLGDGRGWDKGQKNEVFRLVTEFYAPRAIKSGSPPVHTSRGVNGLFRKLERDAGGNYDRVREALLEALEEGWTAVHPRQEHKSEPSAAAVNGGSGGAYRCL